MLILKRYYAEGDQGGSPPAPPGIPPAPEGPPTWLTQVSPDRRDKKELHKYAKLNDLVDAHLDMEGKLGRAIVIPDPAKATPEEIASFKKTMGIPEKAEDYAFNQESAKDLPEADKAMAAVRELAAAKGMTKAQAAGVFEFVAGLVKSAQGAKEQAKASFGERLLQAVGNDKAKAEEVQTRMTAFLSKELADPDLIKRLAENGTLYDPAFAVRMAALSAKMDDAPFVDGKGSGASKSQGQFGNSYSPDFAKQYGGNA